MLENTYGYKKRLDFISRLIEDLKPSRVLDIGCGTGENLTRPLAILFPQTEFVAVDSDRASIDFAQLVDATPNTTYLHHLDAGQLEDFDLVIASEVLEHVETPVEFLARIKSYLSDRGVAVVTAPNGYGPFEWASLLESIWYFVGGYRALYAMRRHKRKTRQEVAGADTLAISPHINFFAYSQIQRLFKIAGFRVESFRARTFLCGFGFDHLLRSSSVIAWNSRVADKLRPELVSAWMFVLKPCEPDSELPQCYTRNFYAMTRRRLNERRWGLR